MKERGKKDRDIIILKRPLKPEIENTIYKQVQSTAKAEDYNRNRHQAVVCLEGIIVAAPSKGTAFSGVEEGVGREEIVVHDATFVERLKGGELRMYESIIVDNDERKVETHGVCDDRLPREEGDGTFNPKKPLKTTTRRNLLSKTISIKR